MPKNNQGNGPAMAKGGKKNLVRLLGYLKAYRLQFAGVVLAILVSAITGAMGPRFLGRLIDDFVEPLLTQSTPDYSGLLEAVLGMAVIFYTGALATFVSGRLMITIGQGAYNRIRTELFEHMQTLPIRYFDSHQSGDLMSLYTNDVDALRAMISDSIPGILSSGLSIIAVFSMMLSISIPLSLMAVAMVGVMLLATKFVGGRSGRYFVRQQEAIADVNGYIEEMIEGQKVVKVFNHEESSKQDFDRLNDQLCESATNAHRYANIMMPIIGNIGNVQYVLTAVVGTLLAISGAGGLTIGNIASFLQYTRNFTMPFGQIAQQFNSIVMALAGAGRIFAVLDEPSETDEGYVTLVNAEIDEAGNITEVAERTGTWAWKHPHSDGTTTYTKLCGDVRFEHMDFGYTPEKIVLHDISLYAEPGQKVAFVGATGAGKTTITNLINRFYDVQDGKIRYDGININKIKKADLRRSLGIVLQDTHLFTGTIMENIRYGKLDASDEEVYAAAKLANADHFIRHLPKGYDTLLTGDGEELSQGQRQLLAIARAAIADPPVLILDEATSSIDTRTEAIVGRGMDELMRGRTVFVIAHRLSTIRNSDVIMVLDHGRIIERGNHQDLIAEHGIYYQLYTGALEMD